jgi:hypothetical protein
MMNGYVKQANRTLRRRLHQALAADANWVYRT